MAGNIGTVVGFFKKMASAPLYYTINKYVCCNEFRYGNLVGKDDKGNEYYENNDYFMGRLVDLVETVLLHVTSSYMLMIPSVDKQFQLVYNGEILIYFSYRNRWVQYAEPNWFIMKSDASDIPAEWHAWMHYMTDDTPVTKPPADRKFHMEHRPNMSPIFHERYTPSTTTKPKIESWNPMQSKKLE